MPRDGSGNYTLPYPAVVDGTTIESAVHNGTMSDIALQLNGPVPIVAGGTGANNAHDAMIALSGELANQTVGNYDTFPFVSGSFSSDAGATAAPDIHAFDGIAYFHSTNSAYGFIEARNLSIPGDKYFRQKAGGVWGAWIKQAGSVADLDARYVNVGGDTMGGPLVIGGSAEINGGGQPTLHFKSTGSAAGNQRISFAYDGGDALGSPGLVWQNQADAGGFVGNSGVIWRDGALSLGSITRPNGGAGGLAVASTTASTSPTTGALTVTGGVGIANHLNVAGNISSAASVFAKSFYDVDNTGFYCNPADASNLSKLNIADTTASSSPTTGALTVAGGLGVGGVIFGGSSIYAQSANITSGAGGAVGTYYFGNSGTKYLVFDGTKFTFEGGALAVTNTTAATSKTTGALTVAGGIGVSGSAYVNSLWAGDGVIDGNANLHGQIQITGPVTVTPNIIRVGALIDVGAGRGYSIGVSSGIDVGVGITDINYAAAFSGATTNCPVASCYGTAVQHIASIGVPQAAALRIACYASNTAGTLVDPTYYCFHAVGS